MCSPTFIRGKPESLGDRKCSRRPTQRDRARSPQIARASCPVARTDVARLPRKPSVSANRGSNADAWYCNPSARYRAPRGHAAARRAAETWRKTFSLMRPLVDRLREKYAFVILDSPPVLAVSDAILLSQIAQKTILVVKWGESTTRRRAPCGRSVVGIGRRGNDRVTVDGKYKARRQEWRSHGWCV